jgi:CubicO group peptidase (beta-lactamase class C family)
MKLNFVPFTFAFLLTFSFWMGTPAVAQSLAYSTPAHEGVSEKALVELIQRSALSDSEALIVMKNGKVIVEKYFARGKSRTSIQSVTKSFTSLLIGSLLEDGKLKSLDENITQWYPELARDPWKSRITVRMLLNHTSGIADDPAAWSSPDFVKFYLEQPLKFQPTTNYEYTTGGVALLAPIIEATGGMTARSLIQQKIFGPMDITDWNWVSVSGGHVATGGGLYMQALDLAKVGQMLLQNGQWQGKTIVSPAWLVESLRPGQKFYPEYGLLWWKLENQGFYAQGWGGQYMVVLPRQNLVAVRLYGIKNNPDPEEFKKTSFYEFPTLIEALSKDTPVSFKGP